MFVEVGRKRGSLAQGSACMQWLDCRMADVVVSKACNAK